MTEKLIQLINREIKEENEPKDTAVLVRVLCLADILFLTVNAIFIFTTYGVAAGTVCLAMTLLMWAVLLSSYKVKMSTLVYLYYIALVLNVATLVYLVGLSYMFQAQLYVVFIMFFYRAAGTHRERILSVVVSFCIVLCFILYISKYGPYYDVISYDNVLSVLWCTLYITVKSSLFALFFRKKFSASEEKIIKYSKRLEMLATTDPLTKLQNRRGILKYIEDYLAETKNVTSQMTIVIGDIDFFKHINDTHGHEAGDYVLETLAKIMNDFMDGKGIVARWGGEEFLFCLEGINGDYAFEEISKLLHLVERYEFVYDGTQIGVTMTFGVEEYDDYMGIDKVISKADEKLYMGKKQGRNRVIY